MAIRRFGARVVVLDRDDRVLLFRLENPRSGNTATPDQTWSPWSAAYSNAGGEQIVSPTARYLQWRAVLTATGNAGPVLTSVTTAYLPRNLRPEITSITVHPSGTVFQRLGGREK